MRGAERQPVADGGLRAGDAVVADVWACDDARLFGDLYLGAPAAILQEIQLGGPNWGPNRGYAKFAASRPFRVWVEKGESTEPVDAEAARLEANQYGLARYESGVPD